MDLIDREKLLAILSEQAPLCREPQVRMMGNGCNCWRGITSAMDIVTAMPTERELNEARRYVLRRYWFMGLC